MARPVIFQTARGDGAALPISIIVNPATFTYATEVNNSTATRIFFSNEHSVLVAASLRDVLAALS